MSDIIWSQSIFSQLFFINLSSYEFYKNVYCLVNGVLEDCLLISELKTKLFHRKSKIKETTDFYSM